MNTESFVILVSALLFVAIALVLLMAGAIFPHLLAMLAVM